jgi:predicted enzyme related to lactoylglutathione lyase
MSEHIDYIELEVADHAAARAFYAAAFGWQFNDYGPDYSGVRAADGDEEVGGLSTSGGPPRVLALFRSNDLDASLAAVRAAGGAISREPLEYPGGRRFHFTDPAGNELGVYQPAE